MARTIAKDHDAKRFNILKTAATVFAREGVARASMSGLAEEAGVSKATIYHYYASKEALLFDILDTYLSDLRDRVCTLDLEALPAQDRIGVLIETILLAYAGMDHEHKIQAEGIGLLPPHLQETLRGYQRDIVARLSDQLLAQAPEVFGGDPHKLRCTTMSVFGILNWFYMWNAKADTKARKDYAKLVTRMTLGGLEAL